jgi:NAD(P)-dependent dehydrogenase (short-subunit alcohol dehydrogenase family)
MDNTQDMTGKQCLVTGASRGIGFYTALGLAQKGADVVIVGHNRERGNQAVARIREVAPGTSVDFMLADLSVRGEIIDLADRFKERYDRLDVLVNNVGGFFLNRQENANGVEMTFALNHLSYFRVTNSLLEILQDSAPARIVNVASESHRGAELDFDNLELEHDYSGFKAYGRSKLANLLFTYELSRRISGSRVTANALHPGFVSTHLAKQNPLIRPFLNVIHWLFARSPEQGAQTSIFLATDPSVQEVTGKYYIDREPRRSSDASYDEEAAARLWEISAARYEQVGSDRQQ